MNYALLSDWVKDRVEDLVGMGVPRRDAEQAMHYVEVATINAESEARKEDQLLLAFKEVGGRALAERMGISERAVRDRRTRILRQRTRPMTSAIEV